MSADMSADASADALCRRRIQNYPILILHFASEDASADMSAEKYWEMSAIVGYLGHIWTPDPFYDPLPPPHKENFFTQILSLPVRNWESYTKCEQCLQMAVQAVWIFSFPALTDGILDMVVTESILVLLLERNEGFR